MTQHTCATCRFFEDLNPYDHNLPGTCHRFPMILRQIDDVFIHDFPDAFHAQWCGEWQEAQS